VEDVLVPAGALPGDTLGILQVTTPRAITSTITDGTPLRAAPSPGSAGYFPTRGEELLARLAGGAFCAGTAGRSWRSPRACRCRPAALARARCPGARACPAAPGGPPRRLSGRAYRPTAPDRGSPAAPTCSSRPR